MLSNINYLSGFISVSFICVSFVNVLTKSVNKMNEQMNKRTNQWMNKRMNRNSSGTTNLTEQGPRENANILVDHKVTHPLRNLNVPNHFHKSTPLDPVLFYRYVLILSYHLSQGLPSGQFSSCLLTKYCRNGKIFLEQFIVAFKNGIKIKMNFKIF